MRAKVHRNSSNIGCRTSSSEKSNNKKVTRLLVEVQKITKRDISFINVKKKTFANVDLKMKN